MSTKSWIRASFFGWVIVAPFVLTGCDSGTAPAPAKTEPAKTEPAKDAAKK